VLGVIGLIWCVAWFALGKEGPIKDEVVATTAEAPRVPYSRLFFAPTFIGSVLASFGAYWALTAGLTWFTAFIVRASASRREKPATFRSCRGSSVRLTCF